MTMDFGGGPMSGQYFVDWTGWGEGSWELQYFTLDTAGNVLNAETGLFNTSKTTPSISQTPMGISGTGQAYLSREGWSTGATALQITQQLVNAQSARVVYRHANTGEGWATQVLNPASPGWFTLPVSGFSGDYEYYVESYSGAGATGTMLNRVYGTFNPAGNASALKKSSDSAQKVSFHSQPANAATMRVTYSVRGGPSGSANLTWNQNNQFDWDASSLAPADRFASSIVDYSFQTFDGNGVLVNSGHNGVLRLGDNQGEISPAVTDIAPATITFAPPANNAIRLVLQYRNAGTTGDYSTVTLTKDGAGKYVWDVDRLRPSAGTLLLEYVYDLFDASGQIIVSSGGVPRAQGVVKINADRTGEISQMRWAITGLNKTGPADSINTESAINRSQTYNAFGEVVSEKDGLQHVVRLAYDTAGKLVSKQAPETDATLENGTIVRVTPTTQYYYDASSQLVGVRDANNNLNIQAQLAGFGNQADGSAHVTKEFHADGSSKKNEYDIFGDLRKATDELTRVTSNVYDQVGRLIQVTHPARDAGSISNPGAAAVSSVDSYTYDTLGNRISHTNAMQQRETTDYDADGRVTRTRSFGGQEITYTYSYDQSILGVGGLPTGGWLKTTSYTGSRSASDKTDYFQHTTSHQDFGGHVVTYSYDSAAHLKSQTSNAGQSVDYSYYANGYVKSITDHALNMLSYFEYDKEGNRTRESFTTADAPGSRITYQMADITYDELNRVKTYTDPLAAILYQYDANGNRRRVLSNYTDGMNGAAATQDFWYKYDTQNRFVVTMGQLSNGAIGLGTTGVQIGYDLAGQRTSAVYGNDGHSETYKYTKDGYLEDVAFNGVLRSRRVNDLLGRIGNYYEYATDGSTVLYNKTSTFDADNRLLRETNVSTPVGTAASTSVTKYDYRLDDGSGHYTGADQGVVTHTFQYDPNNQAGTGVDTVTSYVWWDEAKQSKIQIRGNDPANPNAWRWGTGLSDFQYDVNGHLKQVKAHEADNKGVDIGNPLTSRILSYTSDQYGQVLRRDDLRAGRLNLAQRYYYMNGQLIGDVSNNGPSNISYAEEMAQRGTQQVSAFRYGKPVASADFDQNYQPINSSYPGTAGSSYTSKEGDTLSSIARAVWGDSTLWYLIADANGLTNGDHLIAGQVLTVPNKVGNFHNTSSTFRVYNAGQAIGDTMPILPPEPLPPPPPTSSSGGGCGGFVQFLAMVVAIVVSAVIIYASMGTATPYVTEFWGTVGMGAVAGAAGAAASQVVLIAGGEQNGFDWKGVAMAAVGGAVTAGVTQGMPMAGSDAFVRGFAQGAVSSVVTQGVEVATGLQSHFDWRGVAASAIAQGVGSSVGQTEIGKNQTYGKIVSGLAAGGASAVVRAEVFRIRCRGFCRM
ncbi:lysM domain protein [Collimonas fungivorans]|uniref:LysM domain protein n=1 Tax=Collimonas fungivorans TaxID=158899 RepID=A0A127PD18_9BURK|nr:LysM peptidoglycan-binding domain-containing protein [Collimonas fungivorans]AMO95565.1 lysM domain protein [Collimonas fungivorans]